MTTIYDVDYYNVKTIKNHMVRQKYFSEKYIHYFTLVYINNMEQEVTFTEEEFILFWAHYRKIL